MDYDYIVVGAGSAGCVVAARLTEDGTRTVLLIEAGPEDRNIWIHVPLGYAKTIRDPKVNWMYSTDPEPGTDNRALPLPRGRVLGGSGSINGHGFTRGQPQDYDTWAQMGNRGWSYDDVLPYFRKLEHYEGETNEFRGRSGPVRVSDAPERHPICEAVIEAAARNGIPFNKDQNRPNQEGINYFQRTISGRRRVSTARAYLKPARSRPNLRVEIGALVHRVLFDRQRAVGVEYSVGETKHEARAAREIVVCAGAVNSPQLLELSGVGSADRLRALGIPVVQHLPGVGENLQDHYLARLSWRVTRPVTFNERTRGLRLIGEVFKYVFAGRGVLNVAAAQLCAFLKTRTDLDAPDAELTVTPWSLDSGRIGVLEREPGMSMAAFQLRPESRGSIHIKTADPRDQPIIRPNYLSAETDRQVTVATMRIGRKLVESPELDAYRGIETNPGSDLKTDDELLDYARRTGSSVGHVASTCRMGIDAMAVVDSELLVHGLSRLRVADASIMPTMISGHTNAPAIMIGEKAADLIKAAERA